MDAKAGRICQCVGLADVSFPGLDVQRIGTVGRVGRVADLAHLVWLRHFHVHPIRDVTPWITDRSDQIMSHANVIAIEDALPPLLGLAEQRGVLLPAESLRVLVAEPEDD